MRALPPLILSALVALPGLACTGSGSAGDGVPARSLEAPRATLGPDGIVRFQDGVYDLRRPARAAQLGRELKVLAASLPEDGATLVLAAAKGTPLVEVERLMTVLQAFGIEDYRLDLGR
jgi:hypothetical protein